MKLLFLWWFRTGCKFTIQDGVATRFFIEPNALVVFCLDNATAQHVTTTHVIAQAHVHKGNVTVSLDRELQDGRYANGSNVGVVSSLKDGDDLTRWFFVSYVSDGDDKHVTFMAKAYGASGMTCRAYRTLYFVFIVRWIKNRLWLQGLVSTWWRARRIYSIFGSNSNFIWQCGLLLCKI